MEESKQTKSISETISEGAEKLMAATELVGMLITGTTAPIPPQEIESKQPNYSYVQQIPPNSSSIETKTAEEEYESLPDIAKSPSLEEQIEHQHETVEEERKEKAEEDIEKSLLAENQPSISGSPNPDPPYEMDEETQRTVISTAVITAKATNAEIDTEIAEENISTAGNIAEAANTEIDTEIAEENISTAENITEAANTETEDSSEVDASESNESDSESDDESGES